MSRKDWYDVLAPAALVPYNMMGETIVNRTVGHSESLTPFSHSDLL